MSLVTQNSTESKALTLEVMNRLFQSLQRICPGFRAAWTTQEDYEGAKQEWLKAFHDAHLNDVALIKQGLDRLRLSPTPFVPSSGEFIALCQPTAEELGLPPVDIAYREAVRPIARSVGSCSGIGIRRITGLTFHLLPPQIGLDAEALQPAVEARPAQGELGREGAHRASRLEELPPEPRDLNLAPQCVEILAVKEILGYRSRVSR